jgi:transposase
MTEIETAAYLKKYENVVNDLQGGLSILKTASKNGVSKSTVQNVKRVLSNTITAIVV